MNYKKILIGILVITSLGACNKKLDSLLVNPNNPDPSKADVDLYLNHVQLNFSGFYSGASNFGGQLTRQQVMFGPLYSNAYSPNSFDGLWSGAYSEIIKNANALIPLAQEQKKYVQSGIAKVLKAYLLVTLVDDFGDVPYSETDLGVENTNPKTDGGASIYTAALALLDDAITDFTNPDAFKGPTNDLFYGGKSDKWITCAKTLKLKIYMQESLVENVADKINSLISDGDLIDAADGSEDFTFKYGTTNTAPDSRHPHYASNYTPTGAGDYIGTFFLWSLCFEKGTGVDPRRRFYFYRQQTGYGAVNEQTCACAFNTRPSYFPADMPFCLPGSSGGYWGRDHGDNSGIPPDGQLRTAWGIYPAGGQFDASQNTKVSLYMGAQGAGIDPVWMASYTYFLLAEAALTLGTTGDPRSLLENGIRTSIDKVINYPKSAGVDVQLLYPDYYPTQDAIDNYVNTVLTLYDNAASNDAKLNIIMKEWYLAAWGNGVEPYNNYRRTGKPENMQLTVYAADPGYFIRSFLYPSVYVNRNLNAPQQKNPGAANKVFWDTNPDNFCK